MNIVTRVIAGTVAGAAIFAAPAITLASPAFASAKMDPSLAAAQHDAQQNLSRAQKNAGFGMLHAQSDNIHVGKSGHMLFKDDGGHQMAFHRGFGAAGGGEHRA